MTLIAAISTSAEISVGFTLGLRAASAVMAFLGGVMMIVLNTRRQRRRQLTSFGQVMTRMGVTLLLFAVCFGTVENYAMELPPGWRTYVVAAALLWTNVGLIGSLVEQHREIKATERDRNAASSGRPKPRR